MTEEAPARRESAPTTFPPRPRLVSFDVFGTLVSVRDGSYGAFRSILADCGRSDVRVQDFWEYWEERNIAHYRKPYQPYKQICELSLSEAFAHFDVRGDPSLIRRYFDAFRGFELYADVLPTLDVLGRYHRLAIVSNIDDDLLAATPLGRDFDLVCTAQRAGGYKPDGTLFRYLIAHSGVACDEILHLGQSQFTDMVGGKPLGLAVGWINRRGVDLHPSVPRPDFILGDLASLVPLLDKKYSRDSRSDQQEPLHRSFNDALSNREAGVRDCGDGDDTERGTGLLGGLS